MGDAAYRRDGGLPMSVRSGSSATTVLSCESHQCATESSRLRHRGRTRWCSGRGDGRVLVASRLDAVQPRPRPHDIRS